MNAPGQAMAALLLVCGTSVAVAQPLAETGAGGMPNTSVAAPETTDKPAAQEAAPAAAPSIQAALGPAGDPGGFRAYLDSKGIDFSFSYIGEVFGNVSGGVKRGATYEGRLDGILDIDLNKAAGLKGSAVHAEFYQIHGRGLSGNNTLDLFTASYIEAYPSTKLYEVWFEQKLFDDKVAVRVGQLAADTEFFISKTAQVLINASYGFPALLSNDLPSGGPAYPLATPGVRLKVTPFDNFNVTAAVYNGDPAGPYRPGFNSPLAQVRDISGTNFRLRDAPLVFTEASYAYKAAGLPGTVNVGYVHHFGDFASTDRLNRVNYRGDDMLYGIIDQAIYRVPGTEDQGAAIFLRAAGAPSDRNLIDFYVDGGIAYKGLIPGRPDDTMGLGGAYARISPDVTRFDRLAGTPLVRDYQALLEATYQVAVVPGFTIQPDFQYIFHPGAHGVADPAFADGRPIRDAAVFGLRATVHY